MLIRIWNEGQKLFYEAPHLAGGSVGILKVVYAGELPEGLIPVIRVRHEAYDQCFEIRAAAGEAAKIPHEVIKAPGFTIAVAGYASDDGGILKFLPTEAVYIPVERDGYGAADENVSEEEEARSLTEQLLSAADEAANKAVTAQQRADDAFSYADSLNSTINGIGGVAESAYETARAAKTGLDDKADKKDIQTVEITDEDGGTVKKITVTQDGTVQSEEDFYSWRQTEERLKRLYGTAEVSGEQVKISDHMSGLSVPSYEVRGNNAQEICPGVCVYKVDEQNVVGNANSWNSSNKNKLIFPPGEYTAFAKYEQLGTQTTVSLNCYEYGTDTQVGALYGRDTSTEISGSLIAHITIPQDTKIVTLTLFSNYSSTVCDSSTKFTEIMVISGTYTEETIPGYADVSVSKPFPRELLFTGDEVESGDYAYKFAVPITVRGRNMFNVAAEFDAVRTNYPPTVSYATITRYNSVKIAANNSGTTRMGAWVFPTNGKQSFTLSAKSIAIDDGATVLIRQSDSFPESITSISTFGDAVCQLTSGSDVIKNISVTAKYIAVVVQVVYVQTVTLEGLQLEEGTVATEYEPYYSKTDTVYLSKPLRGFGTTQDYISYYNIIDYEYREYLSELGCWRNVGEIVLSGELNIIANASIKGFSVDCLPYAMEMADGLCNYRDVVESSEMPVDITGGDKMWLGYPGGSTKIHFPYDAFYNADESDSGLAAFKNWLSTLFYAGNPVVVYYPLGADEQYFEACECPTLTLPDKGTVIAESGCEVKPEIRLSYYRDANKRIAALEAAVIALGGTI